VTGDFLVQAQGRPHRRAAVELNDILAGLQRELGQPPRLDLHREHEGAARADRVGVGRAGGVIDDRERLVDDREVPYALLVVAVHEEAEVLPLVLVHRQRRGASRRTIESSAAGVSTRRATLP
jgi:hypothetical protein